MERIPPVKYVPSASPALSARGLLSPEIVDGLARLLVPGAAIVCMGNELLGDDAAGVCVGRHLGGAWPWNVYNVQTAPENFLFLIADSRPAAVLVIDAMDFDASPGTVAMVEGERVAGQGPGTHGPSPAAFLELLAQVHPCPTAVLGIQPAQAVTAAPLCPPVAAAVDSVASVLRMIADNVRQSEGASD
jgi:hydrogenase maturation protease